MKTEQKLIAAVAVLAVLVGIVWYTRSKATAEQESLTAKQERPSFALNPEDIPKVTKLEIENAEKKEKVVLEKGDGGWKVTSPFEAKANAKEVDDLVKSLEKLKIVDQIDSGTGAYAEYDLADGKGIHFVAYKGSDKAIDVIFGKSGGRGQTVRVLGKDGVFAVSKDEYKSVLFGKEAKNWRDKLIFEMKDTDVASVELENPHGKYAFARDGDNWKGTFEKNPDAPKPEEKTEGEDGEEKKDDGAEPKKDEKKKEKKEKKAASSSGWDAFDGKNVETMLGAFKKLNAHDFGGAEDTAASTGLESAAKEGAVVTFALKSGDSIKLLVGKKQKGNARYAMKDGGDTIFVIAGHQADWLTAAPEKFEKKEKKDDDDDMGLGADPHGHGHGAEGDVDGDE